MVSISRSNPNHCSLNHRWLSSASKCSQCTFVQYDVKRPMQCKNISAKHAVVQVVQRGNNGSAVTERTQGRKQHGCEKRCETADFPPSFSKFLRGRKDGACQGKGGLRELMAACLTCTKPSLAICISSSVLYVHLNRLLTDVDW